MIFKNLGDYRDITNDKVVCTLMENCEQGEFPFAVRNFITLKLKQYKTYKRACREAKIIATRYENAYGHKTMYIFTRK